MSWQHACVSIASLLLVSLPLPDGALGVGLKEFDQKIGQLPGIILTTQTVLAIARLSYRSRSWHASHCARVWLTETA